ncbi:hypothetical protein M441DRAFT_263442 [Trichoderma asperellum CBS 433.97]|uniref:Uncharacterized protein n=1 Tax=Trichoderma asperellum (strain ATCC 204424 / CBS 433.97 / NBRC 101777) TaxID=1042311 RepID=A0A2T3YXE9_TRIA4|nr:hypothetical protein M441DRAFT_263442 [Trichoderma asperellum CBS 433.97]PTB37210.1 hypothetical protein M441DRAFT_263442 [Trichoderma asperellum CBS 433.97]
MIKGDGHLINVFRMLEIGACGCIYYYDRVHIGMYYLHRAYYTYPAATLCFETSSKPRVIRQILFFNSFFMLFLNQVTTYTIKHLLPLHRLVAGAS